MQTKNRKNYIIARQQEEKRNARNIQMITQTIPAMKENLLILDAPINAPYAGVSPVAAAFPDYIAAAAFAVVAVVVVGLAAAS